MNETTKSMLVNITRNYKLSTERSPTFFEERKVEIAIFQLDGFALISLIKEIAAFLRSCEPLEESVS